MKRHHYFRTDPELLECSTAGRARRHIPQAQSCALKLAPADPSPLQVDVGRIWDLLLCRDARYNSHWASLSDLVKRRPGSARARIRHRSREQQQDEGVTPRDGDAMSWSERPVYGRMLPSAHSRNAAFRCSFLRYAYGRT